MRVPLLLALFSALAAALLLLRRPEQKALPPAPAVPAAVTPETLAAEVEAIRGLRFLQPLRFVHVSPEELAARVQAAMQLTVPPAEAQLRLRAALALGLIRPGLEFDAPACLAGSYLEVPAAFYDDAAATMLVSHAFAPDTRPDLTARLVFHLARALLQQHGKIPRPAGDDDALLTALALAHADAAITLQRHTQQYAGRIPAVPVPEVHPYHASPPFLRAVLAFPGSVSGLFHSPLREKNPGGDTSSFLNEILERPPRTTSALLHPEHFPAPALPPLAFDKKALPPLPLLTENTLGEFGIRTLFKTQLTAAEAEPAAAGWRGDRYFLMAGPAPGQDHLLWHTRWATAEDAAAFLKALAATHLGNAGIPLQPRHFPEPGSLRILTPSHTLLARTAAGHTVVFTASPEPVVAGQLLALPIDR